jgi:hypothetical protein
MISFRSSLTADYRRSSLQFRADLFVYEQINRRHAIKQRPSRASPDFALQKHYFAKYVLPEIIGSSGTE